MSDCEKAVAEAMEKIIDGDFKMSFFQREAMKQILKICWMDGSLAAIGEQIEGHSDE